MSKSQHTGAQSVSIEHIRNAKAAGKRLSMVTCYDSAFARLIEKSSIDLVLVGDSLGNVMLGFDDTIRVTTEHMLHHVAAVGRALVRPFLVADMPFMSYSVSTEQALLNAGRMLQEGGAKAVKLEGGLAIVDSVRALTRAGIPVMGHLGLTPQHVHMLGGYRVQGRSGEAQRAMKEAALALQDAGAFALVLELVPSELAAEISQSLRIPTIGIGAGPSCDGQVLVLHDLLGFDASFKPKFLQTYADLGTIVGKALEQYDGDVKAGRFPTAAQSFSNQE